MAEVKYPHVKVRLTGHDGNAFAILGRVAAALRRARVPEVEVQEFLTKARAGDYNHLLRTCMETVEVR